jgi:glycosyltransferase involved in cell wall biosynthesis
MRNKTLHQLYAEHVGKASDKWSLYLTEYDRLFDSYRDKPVKLLEIGVQNGGSLEIWAKYFSLATSLTGCDINPDCASLRYDDPRIRVIVGDANAHAISQQVFDCSAQFDIIIDDGSHFSSDIVKSFALYFPKLADGGLFIAEDLHCSYWEEFEGGLFDPYSSITFFKQLADIINHEHWGVPKSREAILQGIFAKYGCDALDADLLAQVHSVEFINSMCILRKAPSAQNGLGHRIIAGSVEQVVTGHQTLNGKAYYFNPLTEVNNPWSACEKPPGEMIRQLEQTLANTLQRLAERENQLDVLYHSTAWRITAPLRLLADKLKQVKRSTYLAYRAFKRGGGLKKAVLLYQRDGVTGVLRGVRKIVMSYQHVPVSGSGEYDRNDYVEWVKRYDTLTDETRYLMQKSMEAFAQQPIISVVMPVYNPKPEWLREAIESVRQQLYPHWELCIADDASTDASIRSILEEYAKADSRIKVVFREKNGHISAASNSALEVATGMWIALLDHDDVLAEQALYWVANAINHYPEARLLYSDEDKIDEQGKRHTPYFKCDWNVDLFYSHNMITHLGVYRTDLVRNIQGFLVGMEGAQDYDLALRYIEQIDSRSIQHIPKILYHWRIHQSSTAQNREAKPYAELAGEKALNAHFQRQGIKATARLLDFAMYRAVYELPHTPPLVSLVIPTRNGLKLIRTCVESIISKTLYSHYEILIIDNGSDDPETLCYFESLREKSNVRVIRDEQPFNYSSINNAAIPLVKGELVALINNDIEVISPGWLAEMVSLAVQPGVGAVGARLWYPNNTLQHGGCILGIGGVAGHSHKNLPQQAYGYFGRAAITQSFSAVTAACLVVKKSIYEAVGGLNDQDLRIAFNDIDFCLRIREAGYRNVWTPFAELYHHESATRGFHEESPEKQAEFAREVAYMKHRWGDQLLHDPAYSPNLTLDHEDFSLAWPPRGVEGF